jgi:hypothetical protein
MSHDPQSPTDAADFDDDDGWPDDACGEDDFDCPMYWTGSEWHCPLAGSEECDWDCPHGGEAPE